MAEKLDLKDERVLVLYTELAPYVLACLNAFVERTGAHVDLVRWPVNKEAPFALEFHKNISVHERNSFSDAQLVEFALAQNPSLVMASGWVDKGYLRTCRKLRSKGIPSVMTFDTAWRGGPKQWVQAAMGRFWIHRTFSHAWATGSKQAEYAANLGFAKDRIHTGFYAADTASFLKTYRNSKHERRAHFPHRFVCVARYIPTKGQQTLCDAFAALCDAGEAADWDLHFVGVGEQHREVSESTSGSHPRITHRGFVQAKDMPATLRKSGVAILPSLYEPWGVVVQEFACMGLPLLLSDAVGARERYLKEGENGFVHLAGDEEDIKRTLKNIIAKTDDQLFNMGERSNELGGAWTPEDWAHVVEGFFKANHVSKPQVLVFIDWYKPYYKAGGPVRSMVNLVEHLSDRIDFHIVTSDRDYMATGNEANVQVDSWVRGDAGERVRYCSPERHTRSAWKTILNERKYDVIYINGLYSRWSTIMPLWILRGSEQRRIVAIRGMLAAGPMKQSALKKRIFLTTMKAFGCFEGVEYQATNTEEVQDIKRWIGPDVKVHLVQNLARKAAHSEPPVIEKVSGELLLVSLARIAEEKNTLFAIERLAQLKGKVRFDLYGTVYSAAYYDQCKKAIANLPPGIEVHWHGQLPQEEGTTVLAAAHALYMPSVGENFGHTMLESLSVGRPLVISDRTPWKGLQKASAGWDLPLEDPALFVKALQGLVDMDQLAYDRLAEGAFTLGARYLADPAPVERSLAMFRS